MIEQLLALFFVFLGIRILIRIAIPQFTYSKMLKPFKLVFKAKAVKPLWKWLYKLVWGNQKDKRGRSFAWFHVSLIGSVLSTVLFFVYNGDLLVVIAMWGLAGLFWKVHGWVKNYSRRPLPGRQRR